MYNKATQLMMKPVSGFAKLEEKYQKKKRMCSVLNFLCVQKKEKSIFNDYLENINERKI